MGLLSQMTDGVQPEMKAQDHVLLLHGLLSMMGADGVMEQAEVDTLQSYWMTLPEFRGKNYSQVLREAEKLAGQFKNPQESIQALGDIESEKIRKKCYVLAADLAMSSGDVDENEDELLDSMQRVLGIDDLTAEKILEVLTLKYAS